MSIGSHQSAKAKTDEWLTPPQILDPLGKFDLDPCSPINRPWPTATNHYTIKDNGLNQPWEGRVWCNPPYGRETGKWLSRCADHGNAMALVFARTETEMFFEHIWSKAVALLFLKGRLHFHRSDGVRAAFNAGGPSVLVAYSANNAFHLLQSRIPGAFVSLNTPPTEEPQT